MSICDSHPSIHNLQPAVSMWTVRVVKSYMFGPIHNDSSEVSTPDILHSLVVMELTVCEYSDKTRLLFAISVAMTKHSAQYKIHLVAVTEYKSQ